MAAIRRGRGEDGISFEHARDTECLDARFHRHCEGRWRGSISMGYDADGRRIRRKVSGRTKTGVQAELVRLREELGRAPKSSRKYTVNEAVADWLTKGLPGRSKRTTDLYEYAVGHLLKKVGSRPLSELSAGEVRAALESLTGQLSTRTLGISRLCLERAIRFAQADDRVGRNVAEVIETPQGRSGRTSKSLTLGQAEVVLKAAEGERLINYVVVSLLSGVRTEEVRALQWSQVHLTELPEAVPHIDVWRSVRASGDTKTPKSRRSLQLPAVAVEALKLQQEWQEKDRLIAGEKWQENGLVFASAVGTPLDASHVRRAFRRICLKAGIPGQWTPRELRHTFVSLMSETGMAVEEISHLVGHSSTSVTETVYRKELRPVIRSGAETMNLLFPGSAPTQESGPSTGASPDIDPPAGTVRRRPRRTTDSTRAAQDSDVVVRRKRRVTDADRAGRGSA